MRLFAFSIIIAIALVVLSLFFFDVGGEALRQQLLLVLLATVGGATALGLLLALIEGRHERKRQQKRQSFLRAPARSFHVMLSPQAAVAASGEAIHESVYVPEPMLPEPTPEPEIPETVSAPEAISTPVEELVETEVSEPEESEIPSNGMVGTEAFFPESIVEEEPVVERGPADQILYLARDFELSEIKRVFRIWQMTHDDQTESDELLGRWVSRDGTLVEVLNDKDGSPCIEIRGPMADELAEFLPQDLPVYPSQPQRSELI